MITFFSASISYANDSVDVEFLEWLGQVAEVEALGVDVDELLNAHEPESQSESDEEITE